MRKLFSFTLVAFLLTLSIVPVFAHSGRTDSNGGHWNRKAGTYHYHNGGYTKPAPAPIQTPKPEPAPTQIQAPLPKLEQQPAPKTNPEPISQPKSNHKSQSTVNVKLSGKPITFDVQPVIENGRTLVPLRIIFEELGANVQWDEKTQTVTATKDNTIIKLIIGGVVYQNNKLVTLDVPAKVVDGRTMVPLRFVSEAMGCQVGWDEAAETVNITNN